MYKVKDITDYISGQGIEYSLSGNMECTFDKFSPLNNIEEHSITWVRHANNLDYRKINNTHDLVLVASISDDLSSATCTVISVQNPHREFFRIVAHFFANLNPDNRDEGVEESAIVETNQIGQHVYIGHHTFVGKDVIIGNHVTILNNVTIQGIVQIGDYTTIESGTTIGACGFGYAVDEKGDRFCVPHFGKVIIGKNVMIGANNAISRGCLSDTIIEDYVKTDNLCHIAHNSHIKRGAMLTAMTEISGSAIIGENVWLGPGSLINDQITIGNDSFLGIGTVATKSLPEGKVIAGVPARVLRDRDTKNGV